MIELDELIQRNLKDIEFVEAATTNPETQCALLESIQSNTTVGRFRNAEDMFSHMMKEWEQE